jgi:hypothetical protein
VPAAQLEQLWSTVVLPSVDTKVPTAQVVHAVQLAALVPVEYEPLAQAVHVRSDVVLPAPATYIPAAQSVWAVHVVAGFPS